MLVAGGIDCIYCAPTPMRLPTLAMHMPSTPHLHRVTYLVCVVVVKQRELFFRGRLIEMSWTKC